MHGLASKRERATVSNLYVEKVNVNYRRVVISAVAAAVLMPLPRTVFAQHAGVWEIGGFGQLDRLDEATRTKRLGIGGGGRIAVFLTSRWQLEGEASVTRADPETPRTSSVTESYYVGRLNYNAPFGETP